MSARFGNRSLFDVEDAEVMPAVRDMTVGPASPSDVQEFARRYHYAADARNYPWRWGLWHGPVLLGVVAYNLPTRDTCASVFGSEHVDKVWHMGRLALAESAPPNSESRLIAGSLRAIRSRYPNVWAVLTFAATDAGHVGYVYQATNAIYTGTGGHAVIYIDEQGRRRSDYQRGRQIKRHEALERGWSVRDGGVKHRYLYVLGSRTQRRQRMALLRLPSLPYPKDDQGPSLPQFAHRAGDSAPHSKSTESEMPLSMTVAHADARTSNSSTFPHDGHRMPISKLSFMPPILGVSGGAA